MNIRQHLAYAEHSRELLHETLTAHAEVFDRTFETIAEYKTIRQLVAHIMAAEERWIEIRLQNHELPVHYEARAADTVDKVFADWETIRSKTRVYFASIGEYGLQNTIALDLPRWNYKGVLTVEEVFFHMFNHQIFHIGQISMALQHFQIDPPNFDYVFLR
jgi:uncharacterized damage-inducible protein DinB